MISLMFMMMPDLDDVGGDDDDDDKDGYLARLDKCRGLHL